MKKLLPLLLVLCLLLGCGAKTRTPGLTVFAASSLSDVLAELASDYGGTDITFNFDSSGTLQAQIEEGAECDLFLSAAPAQMDALGGLVNAETRLDLLENRVVLAVPEGNPAGVRSFDDLAAKLPGGELLLAIGGSGVPAGDYAREILAYYGLPEEGLTYSSNVREISAQLAEGTVDCGILYETDANSAGLPIVDTADGLCSRVVYPAAVLRDAENEAAARAFLDYLQTPEASAIFQAAGFTPLNGN